MPKMLFSNEVRYPFHHTIYAAAGQVREVEEELVTRMMKRGAKLIDITTKETPDVVVEETPALEEETSDVVVEETTPEVEAPKAEKSKSKNKNKLENK